MAKINSHSQSFQRLEHHRHRDATTNITMLHSQVTKLTTTFNIFKQQFWSFAEPVKPDTKSNKKNLQNKSVTYNPLVRPNRHIHVRVDELKEMQQMLCNEGRSNCLTDTNSDIPKRCMYLL